MDIADLRQEYTFAGLRRADLHADPIQQFKNWFQAALSAGITEPNAMTLATVDSEGQPSSRIVLLKDITREGFTFYTNYNSRKGRELEMNPKAALTFFWAGLERQICIRGSCKKVSREDSEAYYKSRPIGNRLGAWVSSQSETIPDRQHLEGRLLEVTAQHGDNPPLPPFWGGFLLKPSTLEFWQGRPSRLHDRFRYNSTGNGGWKIDRLAP